MPINVQHNVSLQPYNSMSVPARAKCLFTIDNTTQAKQALNYAQQRKLPILVLGEGTNTLFKNDFQGLVILNRIIGKKTVSETSNSITLKVGAGENWHQFVSYTLEHNWYGLENLALIPGLVGAAPMQNIGAYGVEVKDTISSVEYLDLRSGATRSLSNTDCCFSYRDSIFKNELASQTLITSVTFVLSKSAKINLSYPALATLFESIPQPRPQQIFDAVCRLRASKLPMPNKVPNTGSFFKNPLVDSKHHAQLCEQYSDLVSYDMGDRFKLAAAWLIERAGWKSKEIGGVRVHQEQALVVVNPNKCDGFAVLCFAEAIQSDIYDKFGVTLEIEPQIYG